MLAAGRPIILRVVLLGVLHLLAGCAWTPVAPYVGAAPRNETVYLIAGRWHTEIGLSKAAASGLPTTLTGSFPGARYLVFGWGERDYYTARHPGFGDLLRAVVPGPAVMLVIPLTAPPAQAFGAANVLALPVSRPGLARLLDYLWASVAKTRDGAPRRVAPGPETGSIFYASTETYDIARTCNAWTAEALHVAGLPIQAGGVIFAGQVLRQAQPLTTGGVSSSRPAAPPHRG